jgi:hypothetical protein
LSTGAVDRARCPSAPSIARHARRRHIAHALHMGAHCAIAPSGACIAMCASERTYCPCAHTIARPTTCRHRQHALPIGAAARAVYIDVTERGHCSLAPTSARLAHMCTIANERAPYPLAPSSARIAHWRHRARAFPMVPTIARLAQRRSQSHELPISRAHWRRRRVSAVPNGATDRARCPLAPSGALRQLALSTARHAQWRNLIVRPAHWRHRSRALPIGAAP